MKLFEPKTFNLKNKTLQRLILGVVLVFLIFIFFVKISNTSTAAESTMYYGNDDSSNSVQWDSDADPTKNTGAIPTTITTSNGYNDDWCINPLSVQCWILPLFKLVRILFEVSNTLFLWIIDTDNIKTVLSSPALYTIWAFVRDLLNMVFIMALLFSAFCTIFQIESYNYKKMLWKIVLMALLVNFSFPITRFIIDSSNILMYSLLKGNLFSVDATTGLVDMAKDSALYKLLEYKKNQYPNVSSLLAATIMLFMLAITYIAIGALLLVRLIALAILIIFSPIAFVGSIMPGVSSHASQWWDNLFKYSFFGPIMILGVIISIKFMAAVGPALGAAAEKAASPTDAPTFIGTIVLVSVPIVLLWTVMGVAQSMSIAGAGAVMGAAQGAMKWAGKNFSGYNAGKWLATKAAPYGIKAGLKKFERDVLAKRGLSPRAFIEGWKQRAQEVEDKTLKPVAGKWRDKMNKFFQKEETHYEDAALQGNILKEQKELSDVSQESEYLLRQFNATEKSNDSRKAQKMAAILRIMFNNNDQNEFMKGFKESVEPEHMKQFIHTKLVEAGMTEEQAAKQMMDYSEIAVSKGNYGNYAMGIYDKDANDGRGTFRLSTPEEQREFSVAKGTNIESQIKLRNWHWNSFLTENADPNNPTGDLHDMGKAMLSSLSQSEVNQVGRARKDFINKLHEKKEQIEQHAVDLETAGNKDQADTVRAFVKEIEKYKFSDSKSKPKSGEEEPKIIVTGGRNTTQKVT